MQGTYLTRSNEEEGIIYSNFAHVIGFKYFSSHARVKMLLVHVFGYESETAS